MLIVIKMPLNLGEVLDIGFKYLNLLLIHFSCFVKCDYINDVKFQK